MPALISNKVNIWREIESEQCGIVSNDTPAGTLEMLEKWLALSDIERERMGANALACFRKHFHIESTTAQAARDAPDHGHALPHTSPRRDGWRLPAAPGRKLQALQPGLGTSWREWPGASCARCCSDRRRARSMRGVPFSCVASARSSGAACHIYPGARIWAPWNLACLEGAAIADDAVIYNPARVLMGEYAIVSQEAYMCTATHDFDDPAFPMVVAPITLGAPGRGSVPGPACCRAFR